MKNRSEVLEVVRTEHHLWKTCPCEVCKKERNRREHQHPTNSPLRSYSVDVAHTLGIIPSRCSEGSLARRLVESGSPE